VGAGPYAGAAFSFLGVRTRGADIMTSYPHFGAFDPDERAIALGVRAMAGWLAGDPDPAAGVATDPGGHDRR
jgi:hypothetical protein